MEDLLFIKGTEKSPEINFDKEKGIFKISGISYSEEVYKIYTMAIEWLQGYFESPNENTELEFDMDYMNSTSVLQIALIMKILKDNVEKGANISVKWYFDKNNIDMEEQGEDLSNLFGLKFNLIEKDEE